VNIKSSYPPPPHPDSHSSLSSLSSSSSSILILFTLNLNSQALLILFIVNLNAFIGSYSEMNAGDALEKLAAMSAPECTLIRNGGKRVLVDAKACVPGDVVMVKTGEIEYLLTAFLVMWWW
jgi:magnesium-transporting ATPase (P-type)